MIKSTTPAPITNTLISGTPSSLTLTTIFPGDTCTITFTARTIIPATNIFIQGSNTNMVSITVAVDQVNISAVPSSFTLVQGGASSELVDFGAVAFLYRFRIECFAVYASSPLLPPEMQDYAT